MLDIYSVIPPMIEDIVAAEPHYPELSPEFPVCILTPLDGGAGIIISGVERFASAMFQLDVYDSSLERCENTAVRLSERLTARGFTRQSGAKLKENKLHRRTLTFKAKIDIGTGLIYR